MCTEGDVEENKTWSNIYTLVTSIKKEMVYLWIGIGRENKIELCDLLTLSLEPFSGKGV